MFNCEIEHLTLGHWNFVSSHWPDLHMFFYLWIFLADVLVDSVFHWKYSIPFNHLVLSKRWSNLQRFKRTFLRYTSNSFFPNEFIIRKFFTLNLHNTAIFHGFEWNCYTVSIPFYHLDTDLCLIARLSLIVLFVANDVSWIKEWMDEWTSGWMDKEWIKSEWRMTAVWDAHKRYWYE